MNGCATCTGGGPWNYCPCCGRRLGAYESGLLGGLGSYTSYLRPLRSQKNCPQCGGSGKSTYLRNLSEEAQIAWTVGSLGLAWIFDEPETCETCGGSGKLDA